MLSPLAVFLFSTLITAAIQWVGFAFAYAYQTEVFFDVLGGVNFMALAAFSAASTDGWFADSRKMAATIIFVCSRAWLLAFLAWRAHDRGGDSRFDGVKDKWRTFLLFWTVQGVWCMLISSPVLFINSSPSSPPLAPLDIALLVAFSLGVVLECLADVQKAIWVRAGRQGGFCTAGVWHYSRHPNYFGEMLQWWACWLLAFSSSSGVYDLLWWATSVSPLFTMQILLNVPETGVAQANGKNLKRYYDRFPESYAAYRASTSILLPMLPAVYKRIPMLLKRTIFLDFARYEYRPRPKEGTVKTSTRTAKAD
uniref:Steroid 5-alpha reductase C-terminal domain-containing protein n=1 Tax=Prymnesium polylepis TaxID=72548 RepID=A0A7S4I8R3_9EUKA